MFYIYVIENSVNGRIYVGKHKGELDDGYLGSGKIIKQAIAKYGKKNFNKTILCTAKNEIDLNILEIDYVRFFKDIYGDKMYNLADGGSGGNTLKHLSIEEISLSRSGWFTKMNKEDQNKLKELRKEQMLKRNQDISYMLKRVQNLKDTLAKKSKDQIKADYASRSGSDAYQARKVQTPKGIFLTATEAAKAFKVHIQTILNRCNNPNFTEWAFIYD